ncbi:deoxyribonuclease IV [Mycoplasmoides genitalium]|uniref:Probable endonuclease 4 n=2 Tax=Mycoplasmoides genitalium TaxID=2097 RepID=END4_MYCGE|nr:deoxyribonuclease IV [Mycoplasmoides genitalium]P47477.1 RecName: Full=Probable endonuclease 4; AltName: Full=Endodeoxyribonuclease IV; AltName: Full=Endonuclease IV [Mycoplasmoides genitalium G37]ABY79436.1 apurinic endonuclease (APN1) [synthetic Mycoplasma genitalium JCVI-1.0]AAC71456.1 apurinic endonuclease (APN1) [Mycoplasmoides genitalium G37]AFQ03066.1 apurinic endonuclease (APN1) [Mycoplasmoides genitalium M2321]AFQ03555.1 apurinic endonuclease (APN1) [Mycoplasmoides genitalium M6282
MPKLLGSFISFKAPNYFVQSAQDAIAIDATALMVFLGPPHSAYRVPFNKMQFSLGYELLKTKNINSNGLVVHAPYIINCASKDPLKQQNAISVLTNEIQLCNLAGAHYLVLHPGSAVAQTTNEALDNLVKVLNQVINKTKTTVICLETMAGKGNEIGRDLTELKYVIDRIVDKDRIGVCLDTCHFHDSGIDFSDLTGVFNTITTKLGFEFLKVIHLNESKNNCGSKKDRHANINAGMIGFENLMKFISHPQIKDLPIILETPSTSLNYPTIYREEISQIRSWFKTYQPDAN